MTEYFIDNYDVDKDRIYAASYSAGGETMSIAVYIYMAESDEYYGSRRAQEAYDAYLDVVLKEAEIVHLLVLNLPDDAYFNEHGIYDNYHGGGTIIFEDEEILNWILAKHK